MPELTEVLPPIIAEYGEAYEKEYGRRPSDLAIRVAIHIEKVCDQLTKIGRRDAQHGRSPCRAEVFPLIVEKAFSVTFTEDPETVQAIANVWYNEYMLGFNNPFNERKTQYTKSGSEEAQTNG